MCATRTWNKLHSEEILTTIETDNVLNFTNKSEISGTKSIEKKITLLSLIGERSDYEIFKVVIKLYPAYSVIEIAEKVKKGFETLESYRNCDCTAKGGKCIRHIEKIQVEGLEKNQQAERPTIRGI